MAQFYSLVEEVKLLPVEEKEELKLLLEKYLIEERRHDILQNYQESINEHQNNELSYSSNVTLLQEML